MTQSELDNLLMRWSAGELSEAESAALDARLQADPQARQRLREHAMLDEVLRELPMPEQAIDLKEACATRMPARLMWSVMAIAAVLAVVVAGGLWFRGRFHFQPVQAQGEKPFEARSIRLASGSAKISLPAVGYMVVDGPADVDLIDPMRVRVSEGRIRIRVTEKTGRGFVVETPHGNVTDLGTEFGLDVPKGGKTGLVVFDGMVDLEVRPEDGARPDKDASTARVKRLTQGEGVTFDRRGRMDRISSIVTGDVPTFLQAGEATATGQLPLIVSVADNRRSSETMNYYEIVPGGLREDALKYVERPHEWNGVTKEGIPAYLLGADYVKLFNEDPRKQNRQIEVTLSRPAKLYIFFDDRVPVPAWLSTNFRNTGDKIGGDAGPWGRMRNENKLGVGPGDSIDVIFSVWERAIDQPQTVGLGPTPGLAEPSGPAVGGAAAQATPGASMFGIAAIPLQGAQVEQSKSGRGK
jgi:ferric-dicitrate binding protein FerR (iron transport regulator)